MKIGLPLIMLASRRGISVSLIVFLTMIGMIPRQSWAQTAATGGIAEP